jgi:hypothetical protein
VVILISIFKLYFSILIKLITQAAETSDKRCTKNVKEHLQLEDGQSREYTKIVCNYGHRDSLDFFFIGDIGGK